jgi:DNA-binding NarL/FixJ family response regulator
MPVVSSAPGETSVLLIEEQVLVRTALRTLLDATPGLSVVAEAGDCVAALDLARTHVVDVVLVSGRIAECTEATSIPALRRAMPEACVLLLSRDPSRTEIADAVGAHGCLPSDAGVPELCAMVASVLGGRCSGCAIRPHCPVPRIAVALSRRERQVAIRVAEGLMSKQIAASLGVSLRTVHTYRESLARKLGASSAAVITRYVLQSGLTD